MEQKKYLFVASTGGHLAQLVHLSKQLAASPDSLWVTFDSEQSRSLLDKRRILFVPYIKSRDFFGVVSAAWRVGRLLRQERFDETISTGAALALSVMPLAKLRGMKTTYIESVSRVSGPSLSGKIIALLRLADLYTQHHSWASGRWKPHQSVLRSFRVVDKPRTPNPKIFVTLGTIQRYRFDSLVDKLLDIGVADDRTVWQLGFTSRGDLPGKVHEQMSADEFITSARDADVVVTHSGVGTILQLLDLGIYPVVVPRDPSRDEHVDRHQFQIAELLMDRKIAMVREVDGLTRGDIDEASGRETAAIDFANS